MSNYNPIFKEVADKFYKKMGDIKCPHCSINKDFNASISTLPIVDHFDYADHSKAMAVPYVSLTCPECGHTDFFNAKTAELF